MLFHPAGKIIPFGVKLTMKEIAQKQYFPGIGEAYESIESQQVMPVDFSRYGNASLAEMSSLAQVKVRQQQALLVMPVYGFVGQQN